jgi:hypothetical protein
VWFHGGGISLIGRRVEISELVDKEGAVGLGGLRCLYVFH